MTLSDFMVGYILAHHDSVFPDSEVRTAMTVALFSKIDEIEKLDTVSAYHNLMEDKQFFVAMSTIRLMLKKMRNYRHE